MQRNYYEILGISPYANEDEIKQAYRKLIIIYHPDRNKNGEEMTKILNEAVSVLMDKDMRKKYDDKIFKTIDSNIIAKNIEITTSMNSLCRRSL
jgi:curved DNA-binding protein CbpA